VVHQEVQEMATELYLIAATIIRMQWIQLPIQTLSCYYVFFLIFILVD
jgi:hypothetical protein